MSEARLGQHCKSRNRVYWRFLVYGASGLRKFRVSTIGQVKVSAVVVGSTAHCVQDRYASDGVSKEHLLFSRVAPAQGSCSLCHRGIPRKGQCITPTTTAAAATTTTTTAPPPPPAPPPQRRRRPQRTRRP